MTPQNIREWILAEFDHVVPKPSWGETSFFVNPANKLPSGTYFATIKEKDGENDKTSNLNRDGVFRLSFGPGKEAFGAKFGAPAARPPKGGQIAGDWNFEELDVLTPHPIYGWMSWMAILNPTTISFKECQPLLSQAYEKAFNAARSRIKKLEK